MIKQGRSLMEFLLLGALLTGFLVGLSAEASVPSGDMGGSGDLQKPLEVNGQSRNLNMMLVLRNDKDKIKFVKVRENYHDEILADSEVSKAQAKVQESKTQPTPAEKEE